MIDNNNFKQLLQYLGFSENNHIFSKNFPSGNFYLKVDFQKEQIMYPEDQGFKVHERQTCNFSSDENFVVFECVHRLLEKGYNPKHIELEPKWKLGHGASGGRADILVKDQEEKSLLIIECKTAGDEFKKEKQKMLSNGGQLFSYFQQERSTEYLCLYTSDFINDTITYENAIVKTQDRQQDIQAFNDGDENIKLYKNAQNNQELFEVWKETFNCYFHYKGIFEYDVNAYEIGIRPLKKENLKPFLEATGLFNAFMEILRHNNISDNANAFNRILSLLLCKIVDEKKEEGEVLDFQVKEGEDTPERIQDRLQRLYAEGMKQYLDEAIVYFEDEEIQNIIEHYRETPIEKIEDMFKQIKYYTQNEFALKEVHNRELFLQNARVLNEIIKMLQNYQFRYSKKQQMLGDFFELLLNHGIKQNEGQFFTPVPIVRFMILSLGLDKIAKRKLAQKQNRFLPKILDFACGAGHFLTESIDELQHFIEHMQDNEIQENEKQLLANIKQYKQSTQWAKDYIFGIEKDYRLARTSQIACFLNGDGDANIIFGDGLENHERLNLKEKFDVILSNPPYSIKSFKNYVSSEVSQNFTLFQQLTESSKEIETLFVERTAQLLKDGARAAIILPSPILSNDSELHQQTRKIILEHFNIKAIASFGSGTFGATGTNTVILFLEKRNPDYATDRRYISEDLFSQIARDSYLDRERLLELFIDYRNLDIEDYKTLMGRNPNENIKKQTFYQDYQTWFDNLTEIKKLKQQKTFTNLKPNEQKQELEKRFYDKILAKEQEKFYYFMLTLKDDLRIKATNGEAYKQQKTIIIQSQLAGKQNAKDFLGYEFSTRKGNEGIKINRNAQGQAINKMYDDNDHTNSQKANSYILKHFENKQFAAIDESLQDHLKVATLTHMLDFEKAVFSNTLSLNPKSNSEEPQNTEIKSQWELVRLEKLLLNINGNITKIEKKEILEQGDIPVITQEKIFISGYSNHDKVIDDLPLILFGDHTCTFKYIDFPFVRGADGTQLLKIDDKKLLPKCFYYMCFLLEIPNKDKYERHFKYLKEIKIPLPPPEIQTKIVSECEAIDQESQSAQQTITQAKAEIESKVKAVIDAGHAEKKLGEIAEITRGASPRPIRNYLTENESGINWIRIGDVSVSSKYITATQQKITIEGAKKSKIVKKGDFILSNSMSYGRPYILDIDGCVHDGWLILSDVNLAINKDYLYNILSSQLVQEQFSGLVTGVTVDNLNVSRVRSVTIPVPPLEEQNQLIREVELLEDKISRAQQTIEQAPKQKQMVLTKHLQ